MRTCSLEQAKYVHVQVCAPSCISSSAASMSAISRYSWRAKADTKHTPELFSLWDDTMGLRWASAFATMSAIQHLLNVYWPHLPALPVIAFYGVHWCGVSKPMRQARSTTFTPCRWLVERLKLSRSTSVSSTQSNLGHKALSRQAQMLCGAAEHVLICTLSHHVVCCNMLPWIDSLHTICCMVSLCLAHIARHLLVGLRHTINDHPSQPKLINVWLVSAYCESSTKVL